MKKIVLYNNQITLGISEKTDGNMRYFANSGQTERGIINNQENLAKSLSLQNVVRINTQYIEETDFTKYKTISHQNCKNFSITLPEANIVVSDGIITREKELGILLPLADCAGVIVYDPEKEILGICHSGRHNLEQFGLEKFIQTIIKNYNSNPAKLNIFLSPYAHNYKIYNLKNKLILAVIMEQLLKAGILRKNITDCNIDTVKNTAFPSNSSGDFIERFAIVAKINKKQAFKQ